MFPITPAIKKIFSQFPKLTKRVEFVKNNIKYRKYYFLDKLLVLTKKNTYEYRKTYLFNILISKKIIKKITTNTYNLKRLFEFTNNIDKNNKVDIIIPIFNGYEYLENLFNTVIENTDLDYKLIVINDNSSDSRVLSLLEKYKNILGSKMILVSNEENLGFVKSVNKALKISTENVILLNSDVIVPKNWASRLLAPIINNNKIASVTPFSNAATIFSLPENCKDNIFNEDLQKVDNELSKLNTTQNTLNFPTGVGFCMAMNKDAIKNVGLLDEIFDKGYGEENDWCQKAITKGYINTIAGNVFVWHKHGGSFDNQEKQNLIKKHLKIVTKRYPKYFNMLGELLNNKDYLSLRFWTELLYMKAISSCNQVWFDHTWGSGTETYTLNKIKDLKNDNLIVRIQNNGTDLYRISYYYKEYKNELLINLSDVEVIIKQLMPNLIVVNNLASYKDILGMLEFIEHIKNDLGVKISFRGHDFQCICPSITMVNSNHEYCNSQNTSHCSECFKQFKQTPIKINSIEEWQKKWFYFMNNVADEIVVFSNSTKEIFLKFCPDINSKITVVPHKVNELRKVQIPPHKNFNIGVLGNLEIDKGLLIIKEIDNLLPKYPNIKFKTLGACKHRFKNIKVLGRYKVADLPNIIEKEEIDMVFIPSVWPETFSYTTGEAMSMGIPVACFNIGAPAERNTNGCIISTISGKCALNEINDWIKTRRAYV